MANDKKVVEQKMNRVKAKEEIARYNQKEIDTERWMVEVNKSLSRSDKTFVLEQLDKRQNTLSKIKQQLNQ